MSLSEALYRPWWQGGPHRGELLYVPESGIVATDASAWIEAPGSAREIADTASNRMIFATGWLPEPES